MSKRELQNILQSLRRELTRVLGDQLESMILYGSQARGHARSDSDIDVLLVVRDDSDYADLIRRTSAAVSALSLQHDVALACLRFQGSLRAGTDAVPAQRAARRGSRMKAEGRNG